MEFGKRKFFYVTTPTYYINDAPHIGHFYTTLISDVVARFMKLDGYRVKFTTGTDEHGQKVEETARKCGEPVHVFADRVSSLFVDLIKKAKFCCSDFIRTTEERNKEAAIALWKRLQNNDKIYFGRYVGFYSVRDEAFYQERDLINGKAPTGADVELIEEPCYFLKLSELQDKLLEFYRKNPDFVVPQGKYNEVISFVESGLKDLSVSRSKRHLSWGVEVPGNPDHLIYVWVDALSNYIASTGFPDEKCEEYQEFWCSDSPNAHVIGKDILRFHAVYWPAILMAADLPLPKKLVVHGWWLNEGQKISKSLGNTIDPMKLINDYGLENIRYFLLSEAPLGNDLSFSKSRLAERVNCDLSNNIGNLVQRTLTLVHKECSGAIPEVRAENFLEVHEDTLQYDSILEEYMSYMKGYRLFEALKYVIRLSAEANEYIARKAPWKIFKENRPLAEVVVFKLLEYIRCVGILMQPFVPEAASEILTQISLPAEDREFSSFSNPNRGGVKVQKPTPVFSKLEQEI